MMVFSAQEYRQRSDRASKLMAEHDLDAILITSANNLTYFTGYRTNLFDSNFRPFLAVIPADGEPTLILPNLEKGVGEETSWIDDLRVWGADLGNPLTSGMFAKDAVGAAVAVLKEKKLENARVGIELGFGQRIGMSVNEFDQLRSQLPAVEWRIDADLLAAPFG